MTQPDEDPDAVPIRRPVVDFLYHEPELRAYVADFVPQRGVSDEQKESVDLPDGSPAARRVGELLADLADACGMGSTVVKVGHGGGDRFTLFAADGTHADLSAATPAVRADAAVVLRVIAEELQLEFVRRRGWSARRAG